MLMEEKIMTYWKTHAFQLIFLASVNGFWVIKSFSLYLTGLKKFTWQRPIPSSSLCVCGKLMQEPVLHKLHLLKNLKQFKDLQ